jgi:hypothetical protein
LASKAANNLPRNPLTGLASAGIVLMATLLAATPLRGSDIFRQSRFVTALIAHESVEAGNLLTNSRNLDLFTKFLGAVTAAYINFEMIPVNEAGTFVAVFESLGADIAVEGFAYHGKTLVITGSAPGEAEAEAFRAALEAQGHFSAVSAILSPQDEGGVGFEISCASSG